MKQVLLMAGAILLLSGTAFAQTSGQGNGSSGGSAAQRAPTQSTASSTTASTTTGEALTDNQITQKLEGQGYTNVKVTSHATTSDQVMASKGGRQLTLAVNPMSGQVINSQ